MLFFKSYFRLTERFNQTLTTHLMKVVNDNADDWDLHVDPILFGYRTNTQKATKMSPFELMFGVKARIPIDIQGVEDCDGDEEMLETRLKRVLELDDVLVGTRELAKENIKEAQATMKKRYDLKRAPPTYQVGDKVLKYNRRRETRMGDKLQVRYSGPYIIERVLGKGVYQLRDGEKVLKTATNACNLKAFNLNEPTSPSQRTPTKRNKSTSSCDQSPRAHGQSASETSAMWLPHKHLTVADQETLEGRRDNGWLNDRHVDAINNLVSTHLGSDAAQTTLLSQGAGVFRPEEEGSMQLLYDHQHWVAVAHTKEHVIVADSLGEGHPVSEEIVRQLKQLFPTSVKSDGYLTLKSVQCAQQSNGSDCGVFATAFLFEWATSTVKSDLSVRFDIVRMRVHLGQCLENDTVVPFPKIRSSRAGNKCTTSMHEV